MAAADVPSENPEPTPARVRKLYRIPEGRMISGVANGLAAHLGVPVFWVRAAFVVLLLGNGLGALLYAAFWFAVPMGLRADSPPTTWQYGSIGPYSLVKEPQGWRRGLRAVQQTLQGEPLTGAAPADGSRPRPADAEAHRGPLLALIALVAGVLVLFNTLTRQSSSPYIWPFLVAGLGVAVVWRQADDARWARWFSLGDSRRSSAVARLSAGVALVVAGVVGFLIVSGSFDDFAKVAQAVLAVLAGVLLLAGPYLLRMWQDLSTERRERIRAQERAEVAAHIHDSVLHTLTLILRNADDPKEVSRLARAQERDLRQWLYRPTGADEPADTPDTLAESLRRVAAEVEDAHGIPVEVVCVGDCPMDEKLAAQLQAAREALVNAAKYGGGEPVSVYAEVEGNTVWVFVRDRGPGFDLAAVPEDRMGVRGSIIGRMQRHGGHARVRPAPAGGTEVELEMERASG
ncbi:ATP-binding protein [Streptacidiphilus sp. PB12-B1b]|uniref:ATP-binding protein n=1 Tax=Streptacidiphilus sp. PB12-B1b TaxID=2705012 RepID=UPI001CDC9669|nr:ATP-binding protein [Streptacidiphilus sp. PB12-B1b]